MEIQVLQSKYTCGMTPGWRTVWIVAARSFFKELIFEKHCAIFFGKDLLAVLPTNFEESLIFQLCMRRPEPSLRSLSLFPRYKVLFGIRQPNSKGVLECVFWKKNWTVQKKYCKERITSYTHHVSRSGDAQKDLWISLKLPSLFNTNTAASFVDDDGIEVSLFVLSAL